MGASYTSNMTEAAFDGCMMGSHLADPDDIKGVVLEQLCPTLIEALSNISQHASATTTDITLACTPSTVELTVSDNGVGIDPRATPGHGLQNIQARAQRLNGTATLTAADGGGTTLVWTAAIAPQRGQPTPS